MPHVQSADRVVATVQATESGDWQVLSVPVGFQGISATRFADNDLVGGFVLFEDGVNFEVYDGDVADNFLEILNVAGTPTLARPSDANILVSSNNDNRVAAGSGSHTLVLCQGGASFARFLRETNPTWKTFTSGDATPSVAGFRHFKTNGTTAITQFDDMAPGQLFRVRRNGSDITLTYAADKIDLPGGANLTLTADSPVAVFVNDGGVARYVGGSTPTTLTGLRAFPDGATERGTPVRTHHIVESVEAAPPGSPTEGARYLVAASGTSGDFVGQENKIAVYVNAAWQYLPPAEGWTLYNKALDRRVVYAGAAWIAENRAERAAIEAVYRVEDYGTLVVADSAAAAGNVTAFNAAYAAAVADGGGVILWPRGQYYVTNILSPGVLWIQDAAMRILADGITVEGSGDLDTELVLADDSDSYIFVIGRRGDASSSITGQAVHNCAIRNLRLDGNGPNQAPSTPTTDFENHWSAIEVAEGCTRITIEDLEITEPQYYGVGFQAGNGNTGCAVRRVRVIGSGADGIDCKNNDSTAKDNVLEDVYVENHGQQNVWHGFTSTSGPGGTDQRVVLDQAGINVRSGWRVVRPTVVKFRQNLATGEEGRVGIRLETDKTATSGSNFNLIDGYRVSDVYIEGDSTVSNETVGITGSALHINVNGGVIRNCWRAIQNSQRENQYSNLDIFGCVDGVVLLTGAHTDADNLRLTNIDVRACTGRGFAFEAHPDYASNFLTGIECIGCNSRGNGTGVYLASIVQNMRWIGGSITSNTTANIDDDSAATVLNRFFFVEGVSDSVLELLAGSFTPALGNANGDPVASYSVQWGRYSVVGSVLTVTGRIDCTIIAAGPSFDALTGDWYVEGLPLPAAATLGGCGIVGNLTNIDLPSTTIQVVGVVNPGTSQLRIRVDGDNVAPTTLNRFHLKAGTTIGFEFHVSYAVRS